MWARAETHRVASTFRWAAEEARRFNGEFQRLDTDPAAAGRAALVRRFPIGPVLGIAPFNFPLNLTAHKVAPAVAAGNAVVIKPPSATPLSALKLTEVLLEAGVPPEAISCVTGPGGELGDALCADKRVRKITFTGSVPVGERICRTAGIKKVTMELGSNAPIVVLPDADLERVAAAIAATGYPNAGQVCISTQRVIAHRKVYEDVLRATKPKVEALIAGDPFDERTKVGPLVREAEAKRVEQWVKEAVDGGARLVVGGRRDGAVYAPTMLADVKPEMRVSREELFGPGVVFTPAADVDEAIALANASSFGLAAAIFTENLDLAMRFAQRAEAGNVHINWGPQWRADLMPYGGFKDSGFGKEGPRYAVEEMTELKMVVFHLRG